MKTFVSSKIHGICVTDASIEYNGSVTICQKLMQQTGINPYEQVHIVNLSNGERWITYALPGTEGVFTLNGGGAFLGQIGDRCVVMTYDTLDKYTPAKVVFCSSNNTVEKAIEYA